MPSAQSPELKNSSDTVVDIFGPRGPHLRIAVKVCPLESVSQMSAPANAIFRRLIPGCMDNLKQGRLKQ